MWKRKVLFILVVLGLALSWGGETLMAQDGDLFNWHNRFLEDTFPPAEPVPSFTTPIDSFENEEHVKRDWKMKGITYKLSTEHATEGKHSLKVIFSGPSSMMCYKRGWAGWTWKQPEEQSLAMRINFYDEVRLDVFNPGPRVQFVIFMGKRFVFDLKQGPNALRMQVPEIKENAFRSIRILPKTTLSVPAGKAPVELYVDNFHWIGPGLGENLIRHAKCFDFGIPFYIRPHFLHVGTDPYSKEQGYGWQPPSPNPKGPGVRRKMRVRDYTARRPDCELLRDYVDRIHTPFIIDLPDGKYRLHVVEAYGGFGEPLPSFKDFSVKVDGKAPRLLRRGARSIDELVRFEYGRDRVDYVPGEDKWMKYRAHIFRPLEHDFEVKGGQVKLGFITDPPNTAKISFLIVYPRAKAKAIEPELAALWRDIRYRFNTALSIIPRHMAEEMHLPGMHEEYLAPQVVKRKMKALGLTKKDEQRGYILFRQEPIDEIYPDTVPLPAELGDGFKTFSPPGEIQTVTVNLFALRNLQGVNLRVGDFVGANNRRIIRDHVDVRFVKAIYRMSAQQSHGDWRYVVMPWYLVKREAMDVPAKTTCRFWINVDIPQDTAAGTYVARATLQGKDIAKRELKLVLEVLPFRLDPVPQNIEYSVYLPPPYQLTLDKMLAYYPVRWARRNSARWGPLYKEVEGLGASRLKAEFAMIAKHGFNTVYYYDGPKRLKMAAELGPAHGLRVLAGANKKNKKEMDAVKALLGERRFLRGMKKMSEAKVREGKSQGRKVILNNYLSNGFGGTSGGVVDQEGGIYRFLAGFFLWRVGAQGIMCGCWQHYYGDPYHPFDGHCGDMGDLAAQASENWPALNPSLLLEAAREGIKDYRYLATLERLVAEHGNSPTGREARDYLAKLRDRIQPNASHYLQYVGPKKAKFLGADGLGGYLGFMSQKHKTSWKGSDYHKAREEIANWITRLSRSTWKK